MKYYDRPHYLYCVVDISGLKSQDREPIIEYLEKTHKAFPLAYPSDFAAETAAEMGEKGHPNLKVCPTTLTSSEVVELFSRCLKKFNIHSNVRTTPNPTRLNKEVRGPFSLREIVDTLTLQQDGISLSQIYQLFDKPRVAYTTKSNPLNGRLGKFTVNLGKEYIGKKRMEERIQALELEIQDAINMAKEQEEALHTEAKYAMR